MIKLQKTTGAHVTRNLVVERRHPAVQLEALYRELLDIEIARAQTGEVNAETLNDLAWDLLTHSDEQLRDPVLALELATRANDLSGGEQPHILDTLALARHLTGDTAAAIDIQIRAVELAPADGDLKATLEKYEAALITESETGTTDGR